MSPLNPLFALVLTLIALGAANGMSRLLPVGTTTRQYEALDGLRGYLALFVVIHHASIWYTYTRSGDWNPPASHLYAQLGQASVAMFFMITGFLFFTKLLRAGRRPIDWVGFYTSRILRVVPLYLFAVALMLLLVASLSDFRLREPVGAVVLEVVRWLSFDFLGKPDVNGVPKTFTLTAGVTWSLAYEWFFYLSLPLVAALMQKRTAWVWWLGSALVIGVCLAGPFWNPELRFLRYFLTGMGAAVVAQRTLFPKWAATRAFSLLAVACVVLTVHFYSSAYDLVPWLLLSAAFTVIACGNSLFGSLTWSPAKLLGEVSYSIYLLHGLLLYLILGLILGPETVNALSPLQYWGVIAGCVPILIAACIGTFRRIERPAMAHVPGVTSWLGRRLASRKAPRLGQGLSPHPPQKSL